MFYFIIWLLVNIFLICTWITAIPGAMLSFSVWESKWYRNLKNKIPCWYGKWFHDWEDTDDFSMKVMLGLGWNGPDDYCWPVRYDRYKLNRQEMAGSYKVVHKRVCLKCGECDFPEEEYLKQIEEREEKERKKKEEAERRKKLANDFKDMNCP